MATARYAVVKRNYQIADVSLRPAFGCYCSRLKQPDYQESLESQLALPFFL